MKKVLISTAAALMITVGFTGQSWAMGMFRHHGNNDGNNGGQITHHGSNGFPWNGNNNDGNGNWNNENGHNGDNGNNDNVNGNNQDGNNDNGFTPPGDNDFPAAPVPEPMSLYLMGIGLAGIFLVRRRLTTSSQI